ncbi:hypothetical protein IWQ56_004729 [Coemansia nantahalensis]|nr:hypothetical protein IWQ56_004729 [Coemansia nantahalensis]
MEFADYARQLVRWAWATALAVHERAAPTSLALVAQAGAQWRPAQMVLDVTGPAVLAYAVEALLVYVCVQLALLVVRTVSGTLYRVLRLVFGTVVFVAAVALGVYFYLTSTAKGQKLQTSLGGRFWIDQAAALLMPFWDAQAGGGRGGRHAGGAAQWRNQPPPVNFQYQAPAR